MARAARTVLLLLFLAAFAAFAWVAVRGSQARGQLEDATDGATVLQRQITRLQVAEARQTVQEIQAHTAEARDLTSDPVWRLLGGFPWGGQNLQAVRTATDSVDGLARDGLPSLVSAGDAVVTFRDELAGGGVDPARLQQLADDVDTLDRSLERAQEELEAIDRRYLVRAISDALDDLSQSLDALDTAWMQLNEKVEQDAGG